MDGTGQLLDAEQVAARLNLSPSWVREAARTGGIPSVKLGRYVRFREDAISDWLEAREREARV